jgi:cell division protein FtsB
LADESAKVAILRQENMQLKQDVDALRTEILRLRAQSERAELAKSRDSFFGGTGGSAGAGVELQQFGQTNGH